MNVRILLLFSLMIPGCSGKNDGDITASGTIEGTNINVAALVTGKINRLWVDEGARVTRNDTLLQLDETEYAIQLRQAAANLDSYESTYRLAVEGSRKEDIVQAEAAFKTAEADFQRMKDLLSSGTIAQKQYDDAYTRYITAQQTFEKLRRGSRAEEILGAKARRENALAQVDFLKKKLRDCTLLAPADGIITLRAVEQGEYVTTGSTVFRITALEKVNIMIYVNETDLARVRLGQAAKIFIDADEKTSYGGKVVYISPSAEFTPKNVQTKEERTKLVFGVKIEAENSRGALKPGMPADARLVAIP